MFCKLPFLTIIFIGIVIFENKIPLSFAKDVSTEPTKVDQVEVASTLKIINQVNEADRVQGQINKKRRKSGRRTLIFNPGSLEHLFFRSFHDLAYHGSIQYNN